MSKPIELTVETATLKQHVNFVRNGLGSSKTDLPVTLIRMDVSGGKLTMFAANKEMFCRTEVKVDRPEEDAQDGTFAIKGDKLLNLLSAAESERVSFKADAENLEITAGFLTVNLIIFDGASLRQVENSVSDHLTERGEPIARGYLEEALVCAKSCTTTNSIRPDVTHVELREKRMLSSDGRKIMIYASDYISDGKLGFKVPATALNNVITAVKNMSADTATISEGAAYYFVKADMNTFSFGVRKVERSFPAVEGQMKIQQAPSDEVSLDKHIFEAMLRGVSIGIDSDQVKVQISVGGTGEEAYLEVSAKNSLGRRSYERNSCGRTLEKPISFPVSYKHLLDTLTVFKGDSVVDLLVMENLSQLWVKDITTVREVTTIIPFRTDEQVEREKKEAAEAEAARKKAADEAAMSDSVDENQELAAKALASEQEDIDLDD